MRLLTGCGEPAVEGDVEGVQRGRECPGRPASPGWTDEQAAEFDRLIEELRAVTAVVQSHRWWKRCADEGSKGAEMVAAHMALKHAEGAVSLAREDADTAADAPCRRRGWRSADGLDRRSPADGGSGGRDRQPGHRRSPRRGRRGGRSGTSPPSRERGPSGPACPSQLPPAARTCEIQQQSLAPLATPRQSPLTARRSACRCGPSKSE
ncbi:conserved hypothetical protein [Streptomyces griseoflavus Tu4000]|uniref:Uncharacterized protein n=1 Tax=Streptomyces griseoflavus Tu4000 TaxID=467200 RepID=D9Y299_9ACTN|nr:conserved hypothetical protein [Streptomyces griseoflavus Tu4000]